MNNDPHETLGLPPNADETAVRQRYLDLVREFPPDRAPERFAAIRAAYAALNDPIRRMKSLLLETRNVDTVDEIVAAARARAFDPRRVSLRTTLQRAERL